MGLARRMQVARPSPYPLRQPHLVEGRRVELSWALCSGLDAGTLRFRPAFGLPDRWSTFLFVFCRIFLETPLPPEEAAVTVLFRSTMSYFGRSRQKRVLKASNKMLKMMSRFSTSVKACTSGFPIRYHWKMPWMLLVVVSLCIII